MTGRTNAGGGGGSSTWYAYIQVSTDANAIITAVNPAGNSYTKTADSTGSAIFVVGYPGTYTISETGATSQTVVVADYGVAYSVSIYIVPAFDGKLITDGVINVPFNTIGVTGYNLTPRTPTVQQTQIVIYGQSYNVYNISIANGIGAFISQTAYDLTNFSSVVMTGRYGDGTNLVALIKEGETSVSYYKSLNTTGYMDWILSLNDVDKTEKYYVGVVVGGDTASENIVVNTLKLI